MELYQWQKECMQEWEKHNCRGIVNVTTGAGKTIFALACADELLKRYDGNVRIRIVVPTRKLASQWKDSIIDFFHLEGDKRNQVRHYSSESRYKDQPFTIYVINTARTCIAGHIIKDMHDGRHVFLIVDECHRAAGTCSRRIFNFLNAEGCRDDLYACLGLSATVSGTPLNNVLIPALGPVIYTYQAEEALKDSIINPFVILSTGVSLTGDEMASYGELSDMIARWHAILLKEYPWLKELTPERFFQAVNALAEEDETSPAANWVRLIRRRRTLLYEAENRLAVLPDLIQKNIHRRILIFTERIEQCEQIYQMLCRSFPNRVAHYHSKMDERTRKNNMELFAIGEQPVLVTCRALDEGMDVPDAAVGIVVSSSSVIRQRIQRLGRIIRKSHHKGISVLYYIYVRDTIESPVFLPDSDGIISCRQKYLGKNQGFQSDVYENAAFAAREQLYSDEIIPVHVFEKCAQQGLGSSNWLMEDDFYQDVIAQASGDSERNYWISMQLIHDALHKDA